MNKFFLLPYRKSDTHKGDYGHVFVLAGSRGLTGAATLCSLAALRVGAGLVTLGIPESLNPILEVKLTEVMTFPLPETKEASLSFKAKGKVLDFLKKCDCVVIGPGLSRNQETQRLVRFLLKRIALPIVLDADGINALVGYPEILKEIKTDLILTPHIGEFFRISGISTEEIKKDKISVVKNFLKNYNIVLVLKGYQTIVAQQGKIYVNKTGNPGMATAGSGDVLTGMMGGFLAQKISPFESAKIAVYLHGLAGDLAKEEKTEYGLIASDILDNIPKAIKKLLA
ncbi:MAG: NAD(P)H-hydrate dehydratase [Candidatus Omnitrophica bacterium]|nr:NAD(P)H-hydrate dehydratase [Candidatus Omnitrophota bacterium]MCM8792996.1 NAD(P)H-hydrate dehydratase [Candidatus Omnitrophota bacterium]